MKNSSHDLAPAMNNSKHYLVPALNNSKDYLVQALNNSKDDLVQAPKEDVRAEFLNPDQLRLGQIRGITLPRV